MENNSFKNKKVLITGGTGMIARQLIDILISEQAIVHLADIKEPKHAIPSTYFQQVDLTNFEDCLKITKSIDFVFNLVGIKCSPKMCLENPADIIGPMLQFNTNMLEASMRNNVQWYLYTSSIGVYDPSEDMIESNVWKTFPSKNDWYGGWAKRIGELQCEAFGIQRGKSNCSIVRPANTYGPYDNFDLNSAMVIPSLIRKASENKELEVWGDGSDVRDFIYSKDVAEGMVHVVKHKITQPLNLGSGLGYKILDIATIIAKYYDREIRWVKSNSTGDKKRLLNMDLSQNLGFKISVPLDVGIIKTIEWFEKNKKDLIGDYFAFK